MRPSRTWGCTRTERAFGARDGMVAVASIGEMKWQVFAGTDPGEGHRPVVHPQVLDGLIKIEWPESERGRLPSSTTPQHLEVNLNTSGNFADTNVNKKSLSLNVRSVKGLEIVKRLVAV